MFVIVDALANGRLGLRWSTNCLFYHSSHSQCLVLAFYLTRLFKFNSVIAVLAIFYWQDDLERAESTGSTSTSETALRCDLTITEPAFLSPMIDGPPEAQST
jgi:hypothetical protein